MVVLVAPALASAHHGDDEPGNFGSWLLWIGAAVALGVIAVLQWLATRRRRRVDADSESSRS